jgi:predicted outer membrane repeat protein
MKKLIILAAILLAASALQGHIIRVPADRNTIQKGINAAKAGDTVLVSPGSYAENINYNGKNITVASLFLTTRNTSYISRTIIDGNQAGTVVTISNGERATAVLSGFTITNGRATNGGGIACINSSPTIENVDITGNSVYPYFYWGPSGGYGGGIYFNNSRSILSNVKITNNTATDANGGGIYLTKSNPVFDSINRCNVYQNGAQYGNDLFSDSPVNVVVDTFTVAQPREYHAAPLANFTFDIQNGKFEPADDDLYVSPYGDDNNSGLTPDDPLKTIGQAIPRLIAGSSLPRTIHLLKGRYSPSTTQEKFPIILPDYISISGENSKMVIVDSDSTGNVFQFNYNHTSHLSGITVTGASDGGIRCKKSSPFIENTIISGNNGGGIYCITDSDPVFENVTISNNRAGDGGGIYCGSNSNPNLKYVTINNNISRWSGGGIYCENSVPVFDKNSRCNIYDNIASSGNDLYSNSPIQLILDTFSVLKPIAYHVNPLNNFTFDILHGKSAQAEADVYVSPDGDDNHSGLTPDDPLKTIGHVLSIILPGKQNQLTIHLLEGRYSPSSTDEKFPIILPDYVSLAGVNKATVIIDAEGAGNIFQFDNNVSSRLSGITITGGSFSGIYCYNASPVFENLIISGNSAGYGGGINCAYSSPILRNVTIANNTAMGQGGGIYCESSVLVFDSNNRCNIYLNKAGEGNDLYSNGSLINVIVDTFTVLKPREYHAFPLFNITFDILHGKIDQANADVYVSPDGDNNHSGLTAADPLKTIHQAFSVLVADSLNPRTIHLLEGKYSPSTNKEFFPIMLPDFISLKGVNSAAVIVDAEKTTGVFQINNNTSSLLSGITITGGSNSGIHCYNSSPIFENLIISGNLAGTGGGISCYNSRPTLRNVTIINNNASWQGGGLYCDNSFPAFDSNYRSNIYHNTAQEGNDLYSNSSLIRVILDTFTVLHPTTWHAFPVANFTFDILHGKVAQADADVYVSPDGDNGNSGLTPDNPLKNIRQAYPIIWADSLHPRTIHLLKGTYSSSSNDEQFPIVLPDFISLAGVNDTTVILDAEDTGSVFRFNKNTTSHLSGITITGASEAGVDCTYSSPVLENVTITRNQNLRYYPSGGGIACNTSSPIIRNSIIFDNYAVFGGGISCFNKSTPTLQNVTLANNTATQSGGGMYFDQSFPVFDSINRCNVYFNTAPQGSDLYSNSPVKVIVDTFTVLKPQARHSFPPNNFNFDILHGKIEQAETDVYVSPGGDDLNNGFTSDKPLKTIGQALIILAPDSLNPLTIHLMKGTYSPSATDERFPVVLPDYISLAGVNATAVIMDAESTGSVFQFNGNTSSRLSGITITGGSNGGIYCSNSSPVIENVLITKNQNSDYYTSGGGISCNTSSPIIKNSFILGNSAGNGGGISFSASNAILQNVTIANNSASLGGGIFTSNSGPVMEKVTLINNSASNSGGGIYFGYNSNLAFDSIKRCNIYFNQAPDGRDLYAESPVRVVLDTFSVLRPTSYYVKPAASFSFNILHGKLHQVEDGVYLSPEGSDSNIGQTANDPLKTIYHALSVLFVDSLNPATIHLDTGTYSPASTGEKFPVVLLDYVSLKGNDRSNTILDAAGTGYAIQLEGNKASSISRLTAKGAANSGVYLSSSNTILEDMNVSNNSGTGLTITGNNTGALLKNVVISKNTGEYGGGMNISGLGPEFRNVEVTENVAMYGGGAYCIAPISGVHISNNTARYGGGIFYTSLSEAIRPVFSNLVIDQNVAQFGGGFYTESSSSNYLRSYLMNVTFTKNVSIQGGGIYAGNGGGTVLYNTILWNDNPQEVYLDDGSLIAYYSDIQGGISGVVATSHSNKVFYNGNFDADPLFVGSGNDPFALSAESPCIDFGTNNIKGSLPGWDILGNVRLSDGNGDNIILIDMGAYEFVRGATGVEDIGHQNTDLKVRVYPNPFSFRTTIEFEIEEFGDINLTVYSSSGQPVAVLVKESKKQGWQRVEWNAEGLPSGVYYLRLAARNQFITRRILKL